MEVQEMYQRFITSKRALGATESTIAWYASILTPALAWLAEQEDPDLSSHQMESYLVYLRGRPKINGWGPPVESGLAEETIVSNYRCLRIFFRWCVDRELLERSPMKGVKVKRAKPALPRWAQREEVDQLLAGIPTGHWIHLRDRLIVHLLFFTGLRVGEVVALEAKHFDCERAMLAIPEGKTGAGTVPLLPNVIEAFRTYQAARPTGYTNKLFISVYGKGTPRGALQVAGVRQMIERRCAAVGIRRLNPHSFRHGLAMYLLNEKGADLSLVQGILRHSDVAITARHYARWTPEGLANTFADVMSD